MTTMARTTGDDERWRRVLARDARADGAFVFAVRSTGIYCRPSCPSRRPRRAHVVFFARPEDARGAGFRACRRCRPDAPPPAERTLAAVRRACRLIAEWEEGIPVLDELARAAGVSPTRLQRAFKQAMGVTPRRYAESLRVGRLKRALKGGEPVSQALYGAGFGASSRLYEKSDSFLGMTPASYARGGRGARIAYGVAASPLGRLLVAATARGVCMVALGDDDGELVAALNGDFPAASIERDDRALAPEIASILAYVDGKTARVDLPLDVRATAFQARVWEALRRIPRGEVQSYGEIAAGLGRPRAARAVGRACASNPVALVVPCHRAVGGDGSPTGYRWGVRRKRALLEREGRLLRQRVEDSVQPLGAEQREP
jgi:AraC family transcriptional regulator of adaptative response/methylated-DNA-[protein]-cysteine methyltransferase